MRNRPASSRLGLLCAALIAAPSACDCGSPSELDAAVNSGDAGTGRDHPGADRASQDSRAGESGTADRAGADSAVADSPLWDGPGQDSGSGDAAGSDSTLPDSTLDSAAQGDAATSTDVGDRDAEAADGEADPAPATPMGLHAFAGAAVRLSFEPAVRAESYSAHMSLAAGGPYNPVGEPSPGPEIVVRDLVPDLPHYFVVQAHNSFGSSAFSDEVEVAPLDGVSHWRGTIAGTVRRWGVPASAAKVLLYTNVDRGAVVASAETAVDGTFAMDAPVGVYRGLVAGIDLPPLNGDPLEVGRDATGLYTPPSSDGYPGGLELRRGQRIEAVDIDVALLPSDCIVDGTVDPGAGWPQGAVVVEALSVSSGTLAARQVLATPGAYALTLAPGDYQLRAFLDVDGDGKLEVNEVEVWLQGGISLSEPPCDQSGLGLSLPDQAHISGHFDGPDGWSIGAVSEIQGSRQAFTTPAVSGASFALAVPDLGSYTLHAFADLDRNGRRSFYDADTDGARSQAETWSEPGLAAQSSVAAGATGVDFSLGATHTISGTVSPAMVPWQVTAQVATGELLFVTEVDPDGSFAIEVAAAPDYYVYAYHDADGDERRSLGREHILLHGQVVDASVADVGDVHIARRRLTGALSGDRSDPGQGRSEVVMVQQLVHGVGGGAFCTPVEFANYTRPAANGSFVLDVGAVGSGAGTVQQSTCAPSCTGVVLMRYIDHGADYVHLVEGCDAPEPLTYPATPAVPLLEALLLDSSAGDVNDIDF